MAAQPNILVIAPTPLSAQRVSCYGYERLTTPNLDAFARLGTRFENAYATSNLTAPGIASMLTGLYPSAHGVFKMQAGLDASVESMASLLGANGYHTSALVNHAHAGRLKGLDRGFDEFHEFRRVWEVYREARGGRLLPRTPKEFVSTSRTALNSLGHHVGLLDKGARETTNRAIEMLKRWPNRTKPSFLFLHYHQLHAPYGAPRSDRYRFLEPAGLGRKDVASLSFALRRYSARQKANPSEEAVLSGLYDGDVYYLDRWLGRLFDHLDESGRLADTAVFVVAPHGIKVGSEGYLSEANVHIPFIALLPDAAARDATVSALVQPTDLLPTILELAGAKAPAYPLQGSSLLDGDQVRSTRTFAVAELSRSPGQPVTQPLPLNPPPTDSADSYEMRMYRSEGGKLITSSYGSVEFYDLQSDPEEARDLSTERRSAVAAAQNSLKRWLSSFEGRDGIREPDELESDLLRELRQTGYRL